MSITYTLPGDLAGQVRKAFSDWTSGGKVARLWAKDPTLWTNSGEEQWLGWLGVVDEQIEHKAALKSFAAEVKARNYSNILLLGMGGSSLCPEVLKMTFGVKNAFILDSTDPVQVRTTAAKVDLSNTLFFVSSKSGSTLEPNIFKQYFFENAKHPNNFVAVTDPGSNMEKVAKNDHFWRIFAGVPSIGGRYSALSNFGMAPAAAMGIDIDRFLSNTHRMVESCKLAHASINPGAALGCILGVAGNHGHDKVTVIASPGIQDLGAWLEQLIAESTGKIGKGLIPVAGEKLGPPEVYGIDRVFAYVRLEGHASRAQDEAIEKLEKAGRIVIRIPVRSIYDIGAEFFRWEIATAVAGSILGINPFDQPDVEASKIVTKQLTNEFEAKGSLPVEVAACSDQGMLLYPAQEMKVPAQTLAAYLKTHLDSIHPGDYFGLLAYVDMTHEHEEILQSLRTAVRDKKHVATCLGFGPRFLHSTGQAYKGGPNSGVFLQITCNEGADLAIPGAKYTFGIVKAAQARGDFAVLAERHRRALRVHLGTDVTAGLKKLRDAVIAAL